ncbi:hypothetical protein LCGC14_3154000, partial [marine sediment metagenome]
KVMAFLSATGLLLEGSARLTYDTAANRPTPGNQGKLFVGSDTRRLEVDDGSAWKDVGIPGGTVMLFAQATAPLGWTQKNTWNDRVIRVVDNTGVGGSTGGSWTISGLSDLGHTHGPGTYTLSASSGTGAGAGGDPASPGQAIQGTSASTAITISADGAWRPSRLDVIACSKD